MKTVILTAALTVFSVGAAHAELKVCNKTGNVQAISIGYKGSNDWTSEGWWNIKASECAIVVAGDLQKRYYYYRAEVNGGPFKGDDYFFCTSPSEYTIVGDQNCQSRGYDRESFRELDTGETSTSFTLNLVPG